MSDDATEIELVENLRTIAHSARVMFNAFLAEGFTDQQALMLVRSWLHGMSGGNAP